MAVLGEQCGAQERILDCLEMIEGTVMLTSATDCKRVCDLVIVGGGIAGSSLAIVMARLGFDVVVLEKERQFRDRVRGEVIYPWGVCLSPLKLGHYCAAEGGARDGLEATYGRGLSEAVARD